MNVLKFMSAAKEAAKLSSYKKCHTGCVLVYKNTVLFSGCNSNKTHTLQHKYNKYRFNQDSPAKMHAETTVLINLINSNMILNLKKITLFIYRIKYDKNRNETTGLAKPCESCYNLIRDLGISHVYYTTNNPDIISYQLIK